MMNLPQNITKRERIVRGIIGALLLVFALLGLGQFIAVLLGLIMIAYAALNYCAITHMIEKFNLDGSKSGLSAANKANNNPVNINTNPNITPINPNSTTPDSVNPASNPNNPHDPNNLM